VSWEYEPCRTRHLYPGDVVLMDDMVLTITAITELPDGREITFDGDWIVGFAHDVDWLVRIPKAVYPKGWRGPRTH
jgi:hypothetical protein